MAASITSAQSGPISAINVTPFVDVVLVLLVVLMVTSTEIVRRSIAVDLPSAATADDEVPRTLNLVIDANGNYLVDGQPMSESDLAAIVSRTGRAHPDLRAVISADQAVPYRRVVRLIDLIKKRGVHKFALDVVPETGS